MGLREQQTSQGPWEESQTGQCKCASLRQNRFGVSGEERTFRKGKRKLVEFREAARAETKLYPGKPAKRVVSLSWLLRVRGQQ